MEVEMSQSWVTHLNIYNEDLLLVSEEASPIPQRKLKWLKRVGQALCNDRRKFPLIDQNKIVDEVISWTTWILVSSWEMVKVLLLVFSKYNMQRNNEFPKTTFVIC